MNLIIKRLDEEVKSLKGDRLIYVQTEDGINVKAEVCKESELAERIQTFKSEYNIKQVIYFDL